MSKPTALHRTNGRRIVRRCEICDRLPWASKATPMCICNSVNLDLGCGPTPQKGFVGIDKRDVGHVDIVWNLETFPWPFPESCGYKILCSHLFEHIDPANSIDFMNELWRVCHPNGQLLMIVPHGRSFGYLQDPTHRNPCNEATWDYFDPMHKSRLWSIYAPKPWKVVRRHYSPTANIEVIMEPYKNPDGTAMKVTYAKHRKRALRQVQREGVTYHG